ncbi:DegT/DnrJ/EryC1/StrS family aminotransferase [Streptomyces lavendulae]|uniref:DegT/DnrJ/EryC1/StrS family aminotransferase n=1 Tax=Streptomyces lavendulae TaxID=1914 RepID=UPI003807B3A5
MEQGFAEVLARTAFIDGPQVARFEEEYAAYSRVRHCVAVGNGTDALELALRANGVGPGDECVLPANSFIATAEAVYRAGATPVLVDIDPDTFLIDSAAAVAAINDRTAAVLPVHLYGRLVDTTAIRAAARAHDAVVVEDAAQSQGATRDGKRAGAFGEIAATSFYPGKNLGAYGDGGAVVTDSDELAERMRLLRAHGERVRHRHETVGFNSRLDSLQAVVLSAKLKRLDAWNALRREAAMRYEAMLADVDAVRAPSGADEGHAWHLYVVRVPDRDTILERVRAEGIGAAIHYPVPIHLTPAFAYLGEGPGSFPEAERAAGEILTLPMFPGITEQQQSAVVDALKKCTA